MKVTHGGKEFPNISAPQLQDLKYAISEIQRSTGAPLALVATSVLSALATATQNVIDVRKPTGQVTPVSLMTLLIADPGERKSTAERICFAPIRDFEHEAQAQYQDYLREWKVNHKLWEIKLRVLKKKLESTDFGETSDGLEETDFRNFLLSEPLEPTLPQVLYGDATPVALFEGMSQRWNSAALLSSEGGSLLNGGLFADMGKLNSAWSGEDVAVDRVRGRFTWSGRLTATIQIQPGPFERFLDRRGAEARDNGLLARFLLAYPSSTQGSRLSHTTGALSAAYERYASRVTELMKETSLRQSGKIDKKVIGFGHSSGISWRNSFDKVENGMLPGNYLCNFRDLASRLMDQVSRVAALLSYYSDPTSNEIAPAVLTDTVAICSWYGEEFIRLLAIPPKEYRDAMALGSKLIEYRQAGRRYMRKNSIRQLAPNAIRKSPAFDAAIERLKLMYQIDVLIVENIQIIDLCPGLVHDNSAISMLIAEYRTRSR